MSPKKHRTKQKKSKKKSATQMSRSRRKPTKASRKSNKGITTRAGSSKKPSVSRKRASIDTVREIERETRDRRLTGRRGARPQSDFQGLSRAEEADSESVAALVEEGNVRESGAIAGVEEADKEDEREVPTRQLSEDDVPDEYLEQD